MLKNPEEAIRLVNELKRLLSQVRAEVVICPPFVDIPGVMEALRGTDLKVGAQNMHWEAEGAYTGEISPPMLRALGCTYVIIGHSERRQYFNETDEIVNKKYGLPCPWFEAYSLRGRNFRGERSRHYASRVEGQVRKGLEHLSSDNVQDLQLLMNRFGL